VEECGSPAGAEMIHKDEKTTCQGRVHRHRLYPVEWETVGVGDIGSGSGVELGRERESLPVAKAASSSRAVWDLGGGSTRGMLAAGAEMVDKDGGGEHDPGT
jgi:hypothetical protein